MSAAVLVLALYALVFTVILARPRRRDGTPLRARGRRFAARYDLTEQRHPLAVVVLGGLAGSTVAELGGGLTVAASLGLLCALPSRPGPVYDLIGAVGTVALLGLVVAAPGCAGAPALVLLAVMAVAAVLLVGGIVVGRAWSGAQVFPCVLLFGLLDIVRFVVAPFGASLTLADPAARWVLSAVVVVALGVLVGFAPRLVVVLATVAITAAELWVIAAGLECGGSSAGRVVGMLVFLAVHLPVRRWRRGR